MNMEYVEAHDMQTRAAADLVEEFSDEISLIHGRCIDIGCGPAIVTRQIVMPILPVETSVTGIDISQKMIEFARTTHADEKRLSFIELDIETDKLPSNQIHSYDNAISLYCHHWCSDIRKAFENIYQLLRPGGKALVLFIAKQALHDTILKLHDNPKYKPYMKDVSKYICCFYYCNNPRASLKKILDDLGFKSLHCSFREKTYAYKSIQIMKKQIRGFNPFTARMPEDIRGQFENDVIYELVKRSFSFIDINNELNEEREVLDRYSVLIAHFKKPTDNSSDKVINKQDSQMASEL